MLKLVIFRKVSKTFLAFPRIVITSSSNLAREDDMFKGRLWEAIEMFYWVPTMN